MKRLTVAIEDDSKAELVEDVEVRHLCDLANKVKDALDNFVKANEGTMLPPVSIQVTEKENCKPTA
jgi:hypothetical protein